MADTHETIADIIAEMRGMGNYQRYSGDHARVLADRLEAAHKRERGDCAKLREALKKVRLLMPYFLQYMRLRWEDAGGGGYYESINRTIDAALSAPPRNCDVGTAQEQWRRFCDIEAPTCRAEDVCHCRTAARCFAEWAQKPYEEGGAK